MYVYHTVCVPAWYSAEDTLTVVHVHCTLYARGTLVAITKPFVSCANCVCLGVRGLGGMFVLVVSIEDV